MCHSYDMCFWVVFPPGPGGHLEPGSSIGPPAELRQRLPAADPWGGGQGSLGKPWETRGKPVKTAETHGKDLGKLETLEKWIGKGGSRGFSRS